MSVRRRLDDLGRIVMPIEYRKVLGIKNKDEIDITLEGNRVVLQKPGLTCVHCGCTEQVVTLNKVGVCRVCLSRLCELAAENQN